MPDAPSFWGKYNEVTTVDLGEGYWVKVKRYPMRAVSRAAQAKLVTPIMRFRDDVSDTSGEVYTGEYQNELVCWQVTDWNIPTPDGSDILPLGTIDPIRGPDAQRRQSVDMLPEDIFNRILLVIDGAAPRPKKKEDGAVDPFHNGSAERAPDGVASAT